ncbi:MAG: hypothetical protein E6704_06875 [Anaerococcus prevotii]|nr:hypothetical protein [Anaerococcus prevotii]
MNEKKYKTKNRLYKVLIRLTEEEKDELDKLFSLSDLENRSEFIRNKIFGKDEVEEKKNLTNEIIEKLDLIIKKQDEMKSEIDINKYIV